MGREKTSAPTRAELMRENRRMKKTMATQAQQITAIRQQLADSQAQNAANVATIASLNATIASQTQTLADNDAALSAPITPDPITPSAPGIGDATVPPTAAVSN